MLSILRLQLSNGQIGQSVRGEKRFIFTVEVGTSFVQRILQCT
jgi:hypothetical protein